MAAEWSMDISPGISARQANLFIQERSTNNYSPIIAVIDTGVDYNHLSIQGNIVPGYNAYYDSNDPKPLPLNNQHGTSCAGIISMHKQGGTTWEGVDPKSKIMPIKVSQQIESELYMNSDKVKKGIIKAVDMGADIINISWCKTKGNTMITDAITYAITNGRGGKGCIICCASGDLGEIMFPSYLPDVLCIGATNQFGEYKSYNSQDNETNWESGAGKEVDLVAPGVLISTLENQNNYTTTFNGTSAAAPHVAGVASLILSINPLLHAETVKGILKKTTDIIDPENKPGHNRYTGYGRVNALKAVELTLEINAHPELENELKIWSQNEKKLRNNI